MPRTAGSPSLFVDITTITVDPAYVAAAARRAATGEGGPRRSGVLALAAFLAVGLVCGAAAEQTRLRAPVAKRIRASLIAEARRRTSATDRLARDQETLRRETAAARDARLRATSQGRALADDLARLELAVAGVPVTGPGVVVRLDDAPGAAADPEGDGHLLDRDLQDVVNALWASGAEAVAVGGRRISVLTAIRAAGGAILVDFRPVTAPYLVEAVGDPDVIEPAFGDTVVARRFRTWVSAFGLGFSVHRAQHLHLEAAETIRLRHARLPGGAS